MSEQKEKMITLPVCKRTAAEIVYEGIDLMKAREELGMSEIDFALKAGWSQSTQQRKESPGPHRLDKWTVDGLKSLGIEIDQQYVELIQE